MQKSDLSKEETALLMRAAAAAGIPTEKLQPSQPYLFEGKTAELLQTSLESLDPVKAAQWRSEAGGSISLQTHAAELGVIEHNVKTREDLLRHSPVAVLQKQKEDEENYKALEQKLWAGAQEAAARNGNPDPRLLHTKQSNQASKRLSSVVALWLMHVVVSGNTSNQWQELTDDDRSED